MHNATETASKPKHSYSDLKRFEESKGYMPFALVCPADKRDTRGFGLKIVGLLVAALLESLEVLEKTGTQHLQTDEEDALRPTGTALKSGREDYFGLTYERA